MTEMDDLSARLTALETVVRQLVTHLAVRADDPPRWVQTRKVLALSAIRDDDAAADALDSHADSVRVRDAVIGFFDQVEHIAAEYGLNGRRGTPRPSPR
jgi:hypothetical protein